MAKWIRAAWLFVRDLVLHFGPAVLCVLRRRHRALHKVGSFTIDKRGGFRPVPMFQCAKCKAFWLDERDGRLFGGKR